MNAVDTVDVFDQRLGFGWHGRQNVTAARDVWQRHDEDRRRAHTPRTEEPAVFSEKRDCGIVTLDIFAGSFMGRRPKHESDENGEVTNADTLGIAIRI